MVNVSLKEMIKSKDLGKMCENSIRKILQILSLLARQTHEIHIQHERRVENKRMTV